MSGTFTKIPLNAFENLQTDAGVLLKSFDPEQPSLSENSIITATTGGITVGCVPTFSDLGEDVDNCPNGMLELMQVDSWECRFGFTALAFNAEIIKLSLGAATRDTLENGGESIIPTHNLAKTDFQELWWVGDKKDGGAVAVHLKNALSTGGFSLTTTKNGKGTLAFELKGHYSMDKQGEVPMEIYVTPPVSATTASVDGGEDIPEEPTEE